MLSELFCSNFEIWPLLGTFFLIYQWKYFWRLSFRIFFPAACNLRANTGHCITLCPQYKVQFIDQLLMHLNSLLKLLMLKPALLGFFLRSQALSKIFNIEIFQIIKLSSSTRIVAWNGFMTRLFYFGIRLSMMWHHLWLTLTGAVIGSSKKWRCLKTVSRVVASNQTQAKPAYLLWKNIPNFVSTVAGLFFYSIMFDPGKIHHL